MLPPTITLTSFQENGLNELLQIHNMWIREANNETKKGPVPGHWAFSSVYGLAVTYFRVRMHTIIGANPFHGPVRDGKEWFQVAIAAR